MKKSILLVLVVFMTHLSVFSQNYGTQIPNSDFEAAWKTYSGSKNSGSEPYCWHSSMSANGSKAGYLSNQISQSTHVRPGSQGIHSVEIDANEINLIITKIIANGSLTNGRMNAESTTASSDNNHMYTDRGSSEFYTKIETVPDSITAWFCFYTSSSSYQAAFHAAVHGDSDFILYGNGKDGDATQQVADANLEYTRTTSSSSNLVWERKTVPFVPKGNCTNPQYILVTMATNKTPGTGNSSDFLLVDDMVLIYNPTLTTGTLTQTSYEGEVSQSIPIEVPFTLTGSMSVSNLNVSANQVIAQLSDANGRFDNPTEIGRVTTNTSGTISAQIPSSVVAGTYKVRVVSTNYPMTAAPSESQITVRRYYTVAFANLDPTIGTLSGAGNYYTDQNLNVTISTIPTSTEYAFQYWYENGTAVWLAPSYTFSIDKSHTFEAVYEKQYNISVSATEGGTVIPTGNNYYLEGDGVSCSALLLPGYKFINWTVDGVEVSKSTTYNFLATANISLTANFKKYVTIVAAPNIAEAGAVSGNGDILCVGDSATVSLVAVSNDADRYEFVSWNEADTVVSTAASYTFKTATNRTFVAYFATRYMITATSSSEIGGTVAGSGSYRSGSSAQLTAFVDDGFRFAGWYEADTLFSQQQSIVINPSADRTFEARFVEQINVALSVNIENGATVSGAGAFDKGTTASVTAKVAQGFTFENWTLNNAVVSTETTYAFVLESAVELVANVAEFPQYTVEAVSVPAQGGAITGAGKFYQDSSVALTAIENQGYKFINWTENGVEVSTDKTIEFAAAQNRSLVANFESLFVGYTISLEKIGEGTVSGTGLFEANSTVTVTATAADKYTFSGWADLNSTIFSSNPSLSFTITSDTVFTAVFVRQYDTFPVVVSLADEAAGTVEGANTYQEESTVVVKAVPNAGYRFAQWEENGVAVSTKAEYSFVCSGAKNLTATFVKVYTVSIADIEGASVKGLGTGVFDENALVTLALVVGADYRFIAWRNADDNTVLSTSATYSFTATANKNLVVEMQKKGELYSISVSMGGRVSGLNNGKFEAGQNITLIATPAEGYVFKGWVQNGEIISTNLALSFVAEANVTIFAEFMPEPEDVEVTVSVNDNTFGSIIGAGTYTEGDEVMLIATPAVGYEFVSWVKDGKILSNLSTLYVTATESCTIEATFKFIENATAIDEVPYTCAVYPNPVSLVLYVESTDEVEMVRLTTLSGAVVYESEVFAANHEIAVAGFKQGVYVLEVISNGKAYTQTILIQ